MTIYLESCRSNFPFLWMVKIHLCLLVAFLVCVAAPNLSRAETDISGNFPTVGSVIYHPLVGGYFLVTDLGPPFFRDEIAANLSIPGRMATLGYGVPLGGNLYLWLTGPIYIAYVTAYTAGYPGNCDFY